MVIGGLQKLTLLDYPEKVACTIFTYGCNFRCPFCHNATLVVDAPKNLIPVEDVYSFLRKRIGVLDGVCLTGGEPLLYDDVEEFLLTVKDMGYSIKLDTNGSRFNKLKSLCEKKLIDYVAMDIKNSIEKYPITVGKEVDEDEINESVKFLLQDTVDYEFRTTVIKGLHDKQSFVDIGKWIKGAKRYYLQSFVDSGNLIGKAEGFDKNEMEEFLSTVREYIPSAELRGI